MSIDIVKAFKAPWAKDGGFARMFLGGLVFCIPILNFITVGYLMEYLNRLINGKEELGNIFQHGSKSFVTGFKYIVGFILFLAIFIAIVIIVHLLFAKSVPFIFNLLIDLLSFVCSLFIFLMMINFAKSNKILSIIDFKQAYNLINSKDKAINFVILFIMNIVVQIVYLIPISIIAVICAFIGVMLFKSVMFVSILLFMIALIIVLALHFAMVVTMFNMIGQFAQKSLALQK